MKSLVSATALLLAISSASAEIIAFSSRHYLSASGDSFLSFTIPEGPETPVLLRAVGPALINYGLFDALLDPALQLFQNDVLMGANDDWNLSDAADFGSVGAFPFQNGSSDAALVLHLSPGTYTMRAFAADGGTGALLTEAYLLDPALAGFSAIAQTAAAGPGAATLISGFVARDGEYLVRGLGPALGVGGVPDPWLTIYQGGSLIGGNDDWGSADPAGLAAAAASAGLAPLDSGSADSAMLLNLGAGSYSALLNVSWGQPGRGRIEIADLAYPQAEPVPEAGSTAGLLAMVIGLLLGGRRSTLRKIGNQRRG